MVSLTTVGNEIRLRVRYDLPTRYRLFRLIRDDHKQTCLDEGRIVGQDDYLALINSEIAKFEGRIIDPISNEELDTDAVSARTIKNFLNIAQKRGPKIQSVHRRTLLLLDAYAQLRYRDVSLDFARDEFITHLGQLTAFQYVSDDNVAGRRKEFIKAAGGLYLAETDDIDLPTPLRVRTVLLSLKASKDDRFFFCHVLCASKPLEFWRMEIETGDKSDWVEERFSGIATLSRDGIGCHLNSASLHIPVYALITGAALGNGKASDGILVKFVDYSRPEEQEQYLELNKYNNRNIEFFIESLGWDM